MKCRWWRRHMCGGWSQLHIYSFKTISNYSFKEHIHSSAMCGGRSSIASKQGGVLLSIGFVLHQCCQHLFDFFTSMTSTLLLYLKNKSFAPTPTFIWYWRPHNSKNVLPQCKNNRFFCQVWCLPYYFILKKVFYQCQHWYDLWLILSKKKMILNEKEAKPHKRGCIVWNGNATQI